MSGLVVVLAGGDPTAVDPSHLTGAAVVIAADSGVAQAVHLGLPVDLIVGDLDSVDPDQLRAAIDGGATVERHPAAKDATDLELALQAARRHDPDRVVIAGGEGGRVDHLLANALLIASPQWSDLDLEWWIEGACIVPIHGSVTFEGEPGDLLTLLAIGETSGPVSTTGLRYPLTGESLDPGSTRGVSNEFAATRATIDVGSGVVVAVRPRT